MTCALDPAKDDGPTGFGMDYHERQRVCWRIQKVQKIFSTFPHHPKSCQNQSDRQSWWEDYFAVFLNSQHWALLACSVQQGSEPLCGELGRRECCRLGNISFHAQSVIISIHYYVRWTTRTLDYTIMIAPLSDRIEKSDQVFILYDEMTYNMTFFCFDTDWSFKQVYCEKLKFLQFAKLFDVWASLSIWHTIPSLK